MYGIKKLCWRVCAALVRFANILRVLLALAAIVWSIAKLIGLLIVGLGDKGFSSIEWWQWLVVVGLWIAAVVLFCLNHVFENLLERIKDNIMFNTKNYYSFETLSEFEQNYFKGDLSMYTEEEIFFLKKELEKKNKVPFSCNTESPLQAVSKSEEYAPETILEDERIISQREIDGFTSPGSSAPTEELEALIGLAPVKQNIADMRIRLKYEELRKSAGKSSASLHMCFYGAPGTGKTTVARIMSGILFELGLIRKNQVVEISGGDLSGAYMGHTSKRTKRILEAARGGVLFVDEAYALTDMGRAYDGSSMADEAIAEIVKFMEDNKDDIVIIFAGYPQKMEQFIKSNEGLNSRIKYKIPFPNYSPKEMGEIFVSMANAQDYTVTPELTEAIETYSYMTMQQEGFANARTAGQFLDGVINLHAKRIMNGDADKSSIDVLTVYDFPWFTNGVPEHLKPKS